MDILSEFIIQVLDSSSGIVVRLLEMDQAEKMAIICWFAGILAQISVNHCKLKEIGEGQFELQRLIMFCTAQTWFDYGSLWQGYA